MYSLLLKLYTWSLSKIHNMSSKQNNHELSTYEQVKLFHKTFNISMPDSPTPLSKEDALIRASFVAEELVELLQASCENKEELRDLYQKLVYKMDISLARELDKEFPKDDFERLIAQADACVDILYFTLGNFTLINVNPDPLFGIVQEKNMDKIWNDGLPRYNEVGKILKPPHWSPPEPEIEKEIKRQIEDAKEANK